MCTTFCFISMNYCTSGIYNIQNLFLSDSAMLISSTTYYFPIACLINSYNYIWFCSGLLDCTVAHFFKYTVSSSLYVRIFVLYRKYAIQSKTSTNILIKCTYIPTKFWTVHTCYPKNLFDW